MCDLISGTKAGETDRNPEKFIGAHWRCAHPRCQTARAPQNPGLSSEDAIFYGVYPENREA
jgi:hypothetical protein